MYNLIVYGKKIDVKMFSPFDMNNNKFVVNLFYASLFPKSDINKLQKEVCYGI